MRQRRLLTALTATLLSLAMLVTAGPGLSTAATPTTTTTGARELLSGEHPRTVTLITGDRITLHAKGNISVAARGDVQFLTYRNKDHHYVFPSDALPLLRDGRLDLRLFDIAGLVEAGYDRRDRLPLIITGGAPQGFAAAEALPAVDGYAVQADPSLLRTRWRSLAAKPGAKIWLDGLRKPSLDRSVPQIGAPAAWAAGFDGTGVKVAVLDTGIDATHPDLAGKVSAQRNFTEGEEDDRDLVGHGTHVASTVAGSKGVAPGATLLDGKVCVVYGCAESWILAGMQWAAESGAKVVNLSLGGTDGPEIDPLEQAVNDLTDRYGTLFVIAAGNDGGNGAYSLSSPAGAEAALAVGAVDRSEALASFSSRGPRIGDAAVKPEITAPGVGIVAARGKDGFLGQPGQSHMPLSGTSMATPHVAGAAAVLAQVHPLWTAQWLKAMLTGSAAPNATDGPFEQGAGRVDVARAVTASVSSDPVTVGFGVQSWPHEDDPVVGKDIVYHNSGTRDVTLALSLSNPAGGIFSLNASAVTVPAGGSASVQLTADTRQGGSAVGPMGGRVVAVAEGVRVQTPYGVEREIQHHTIDFVHTDRAGDPAGGYLTFAMNVDTFKVYYVFDPDGTARIRLPRGEYIVFSLIDQTVDGQRVNTTQLTLPRLDVTSDRTVALDAREGRGYKVTIPDRSVTPVLAGITGTRLLDGGGGLSAGLIDGSFDKIYSGHLGPKPVAGFSSSVQGIWGRLVGDQVDPGLLYSLAWQQEGSLYTGFTRDVGRRELVTIRERIFSAGPDLGAVARFPRARGGGLSISVPQTLPAESTRVVNAELKWHLELDERSLDAEGSAIPVSFATEDGKVYRAGETVQETFNRAAFGPSVADPAFEGGWVRRLDDEIQIAAPLFGDGDGRAGFALTEKARTALYRDGELIGEEPLNSAVFAVAPGNARYRAEISAERGAPFRLGTKVSVVWSFDSSHVDGIKPLPVTTFSFGAPVDDHNVARAGTHAAIPVRVVQPTGSEAKRLKDLKVDVSYDDGRTWRDAQVVNLLGRYLLVLRHPDAAGFVSLRTAAADRAGNTVTQTVIRAYEIR